MSVVGRLTVGFMAAAVVVYWLTPYAIALSNRTGFHDMPAGYKQHGWPTPYLGGAALVAGFVLALLAIGSKSPHTVPFVASVVTLWGAGPPDGRRTVSPLARVAIEVALGALMWAVRLGWHSHMGWAVDLIGACIWTVAVLNAFNLFDNMDGAASIMALVACAGIVLLGILNNQIWLPAGAVALAGACVGIARRLA